MDSVTYRAAVDEFRRTIASGPMEATITAAVLSLSEARAALCCAGMGDDALIREMLALQNRLQELVKAREASGESSPQA